MENGENKQPDNGPEKPEKWFLFEIHKEQIRQSIKQIVGESKKLTRRDRLKIYLRHPLSARRMLAWWDKVYEELHGGKSFSVGGMVVGNWPPPKQDDFIFTPEQLLAMSACAKAGAATLPEISEAFTKLSRAGGVDAKDAAENLRASVKSEVCPVNQIEYFKIKPKGNQNE